jgi:hypothetical protein
MKKPRISSARVCGYIESVNPERVLPIREISYRGFVMSKFFAVMLSVLFLVATAVPLLATDARQIALAGTGNYIEDDYNIFTWYATLPSYSNTVWIGLNYGYDYYDGAVTAGAASQGMSNNNWAYMGASYGLGKEGKYGTLAMFYYDYAPGLNLSGSSWPGANVFSQSVGNKWTVLYAYPMEKMSLGFYFNRADNDYTYENQTEVTQDRLHDARRRHQVRSWRQGVHGPRVRLQHRELQGQELRVQRLRRGYG